MVAAATERRASARLALAPAISAGPASVNTLSATPASPSERRVERQRETDPRGRRNGRRANRSAVRRNRRRGRRRGAGVGEDAQEVLGVELGAHRLAALAERALEAADRVAAALDVRIVGGEQVEVVVGLVDQLADRPRRRTA